MKRGLLLLVLAGACSVENTFEPPDGGLERMSSQPRYDAYEPSPFFADGRAMQLPPEGTVPTGPPLASLEVRTGVKNGSPLSAVPMAVTLELLRHGRERFDIFCAPCHGVAGDSDSVVGRSMPLVRPRSLTTGELASAPAGRLFRAIDQGYGLMSNYRAQLDLEERWAVVAYVQALRLSRGVALATLPTELRQAAIGALR